MKYICRPPGKKSIGILKRDEKVISRSYTREYSFVFRKARGCHVWDVDGRKYLDFAAGVAVAGVGHTNPDVVRAVRRQAGISIHAGFADFYAELPVDFTELLLTFLPSHLNNAFLSNSGTESIECAYKLARWHTKRKWVMAFNNCFHGRTMGSLSMTNSKPVQRDRYGPFLPVKHVDFPYFYRCPHRPLCKAPDECSDNCLNGIEKTMKELKNDLAAVFVEPIQGEGGYIVPPDSFLPGLRKLCDEHDVLLCSDEVQAGCYRTGTFLAMENFRTKPDVVSLSKAVGGGVPLGVTVANKSLMDWPHGAHANTFGGNLLACAGGIATLKYMRRHRLGENAKRIGRILLKGFEDMKDRYEIIGDVRGKGLMIGIEFVKGKNSRQYGIEERGTVLCKASEKGLLLLAAGRSVIRVCPPLIMTREQALQGLDIFEDAVRHANGGCP